MEIDNFIFVAQPTLSGKEKEYVLDCLDSTWISSVGKYIELFEESFARFVGVKHAVATNNGTTALHLALVALGLGPGDEVLVPTVTFIATANAVTYCGARPVLVDVLPGTLNMNPELLKEKITSRTKGVIPVHLFGHPADMKSISKFAHDHGLWVLEDAAEAHGASLDGSRVGSLGDCATFSFFGNKIITSGEGGMVTTDDDDLARQMRLLRGQGMDPSRRYWFPMVGYNYRMTNIQAAIGLAQLETIDEALADRAELAARYSDALSDIEELTLPVSLPGSIHAYWMVNVFLLVGDERQRDKTMSSLLQAGIETRPVFYPLHWMPPYRIETDFPVADHWAPRGISLPTHRNVSVEDVKRIARELKKAVGRG